MRKVIHAELYSDDFSILNQLIRDWNSAYRFAYNRLKKGLDFNQARLATKTKYIINTRQVSDAVDMAYGLCLQRV